jgi:hypothetical protein
MRTHGRTDRHDEANCRLSRYCEGAEGTLDVVSVRRERKKLSKIFYLL